MSRRELVTWVVLLSVAVGLLLVWLLGITADIGIPKVQ
jgi:hypothetical protein